MKAWLPILLLSACACLGQGTFVFDQQSSTLEGQPPYASGANIQNLVAPWGQSFTPSLSSVDFIRLTFDDGDITDGQGATLLINLHSDSMSGPVVGVTDSVTMANGFTGPTTFLFPSSVALTPGVLYYFEPVLQSGGTWNIQTEPHTYAGGMAYNGGVGSGGTDLWFREGIIVPEPSSLAMLLLGIGRFLLAKPTHRL